MTKRIVWIEDAKDVRLTFGGMFRKGFEREDVNYEEREDFEKLKEELTKGDLADVYILDNEIAGTAVEGVIMAQRICDLARIKDREVIVISLLCSNPEGVLKDHGVALQDRGIPVFHKLTEAIVAAFWIGACVHQSRKIPFEEWLNETGIRLVREDRTIEERKQVQTAISIAIMDGRDPGVLFQDPQEYITGHIAEIKPFLYIPGSEAMMGEIFPVSVGKEVK